MPARVALVTGAARGIGAAIAARLAHDGWRVVAVDCSTAAAPPGGRVAFADVSDENDVRRLIDGIKADETRLDAVISNAGIMVRKPVTALSLDEWSRVIGTNLTAAFLLAREATPLLRSDGGGAMVNVASTRAHMSEANTESYSASKGGLVALTHALAISLGPEIRVNCISPGWIDSKGAKLTEADHEQHPAGRVGRPEDVASLAAWLVGPESGFVTGAEFVVDGGMTRKMIYVE